MADTPAQPDFMKQLAAALAAVAGGVGGRALASQGGNPLTQAVPPQLSQMLDQANQRQAYQNPLFQATTQGAYAMLPDFAKTGTALSGTLSNSVPAAPPPSGSGGPGLGTAAGVGGLGALAALLGGAPSGGSFDLSKIFDAIKKKFGSQTPSNNAPVSGYFDGNNNWVHDASGGGVMPGLPGEGTPLGGPFGGNPSVDTSFNFGGDPTLSAYLPPDYSSLPGYGTSLPPLTGGGGSGQGNTGNWWDE